MTKPINETPFSPAPSKELGLFPIPMLRGNLPLNHSMVAQSCREIIQEYVSRGEDVQTNYTTYFCKDAQEHTHSLEWFKDLSDIVKDTYADWYMKSMNEDMTLLTRNDIHFFAWINRYTEPHMHDVHNHPRCLMSGTYYVKVDESTTPIKFTNPNPAAAMFTRGNDMNYNNEQGYNNIIRNGHGMSTQEYFVHPTIGEFLMWPSYLYHMVPKTQSEDQNYERITISFNLFHNMELHTNTTGRDFDYSLLRSENE
jgi:uncharacterized protein (TIGR02466 family)